MNDKVDAKRAGTKLMGDYATAIKGKGLCMGVDIGNNNGQYSLEVTLRPTSPLNIIDYKKASEEVRQSYLPRTQNGFPVNVQFINVMKRR